MLDKMKDGIWLFIGALGMAFISGALHSLHNDGAHIFSIIFALGSIWWMLGLIAWLILFIKNETR